MILDIGANIGASTLYFAANYPQARILAFEPFLESYELLVRNVEGLQHISTFDFGLLDRDQQAPLHLGLQDSATNSIAVVKRAPQVRAGRAARAAPCLPNKAWRKRTLSKLDTEGSELPILRSMSALVVRVIYIEFHHEADRSEIDRMLSPTHMLIFGHITAPHRGELCYAPRGQFRRKPAPWQSGCSGRAGLCAAAPGPWYCGGNLAQSRSACVRNACPPRTRARTR